MINIHDYVVENPTAIVRVPVPIMEVVEKIKRDTNAKDMQVGEIPNLRMHRFNAYYLPSNEILNLTEEQLKIKAIRVPITDTTRHYTDKNFVSMKRSDNNCDDFIYLAYEEQVRYLYSNSNKLFLEAALAKGISEDDIINQTEEYTCYLFYLECYLEQISD